MLTKNKKIIKDNQTTINFRVKSKVKREASKIFNDIGMDMSTALNVFLHNVMIRKSLPMRLMTENGYTLEYEAKIIEASKNMSKKSFATVDEMIEDLDM